MPDKKKTPDIKLLASAMLAQATRGCFSRRQRKPRRPNIYAVCGCGSFKPWAKCCGMKRDDESSTPMAAEVANPPESC